MIVGRHKTYSNVQILFVASICVEFEAMKSMLHDVTYCFKHADRTPVRFTYNKDSNIIMMVTGSASQMRGSMNF